MTPLQRDRLPELMREIVDTDRDIEMMARSPLVCFMAAVERRKRRAELSRHAAKLWGPRLGKDNTATN